MERRLAVPDSEELHREAAEKLKTFQKISIPAVIKDGTNGTF